MARNRVACANDWSGTGEETINNPQEPKAHGGGRISVWEGLITWAESFLEGMYKKEAKLFASSVFTNLNPKTTFS